MSKQGRIYVVPVLTESPQAELIMRVPGYSHLVRRRAFYAGGCSHPVADAVLLGYSNKAEAQWQVDLALGAYLWRNLNNVEAWQG